MINKEKFSVWYDKNYKLLLLIPVLIVLASLIYLVSFYAQNGDIMYKDVSLRGGTTITINGDIDTSRIEQELPNFFKDVSFRKLTEVTTGKQVAMIVESSATPDELKAKISDLGILLTDENSNIEFTGSSLSAGFYKQLLFAIILSFILMSAVIFFLFKSFIPSLAIIFAAFSDIIIPLAILDVFGFSISSAGIAAFLMLIGYSVDDNILLTTRALKKKEGNLNHRLFGAFKTGVLMSSMSLFAVMPAFLFITGLPDSFRQIFLILSLGLIADIIVTWLANASIIKWYCEAKNIK
jgi:preprotein translocase subunit SecF